MMTPEDSQELFRLVTKLGDAYRTAYFNRCADDEKYKEFTRRQIVKEIEADIGDVLNEFASRYPDGYSHALIDELRQRIREVVLLHTPIPTQHGQR